MGTDRRSELFRDLVVVVPGVLQGERGGARQLPGTLADLLLDGPLPDAQPERARDKQRGGEHRREQEHQLEPQRHPAVL